MEAREQILAAFSRVLLLARREARLSQRALAVAGGFNHSFIVRMEKGLRLPAIESLIALERAMNLSPGTLTKLTVQALENPIQAVTERPIKGRSRAESPAPDAEVAEGENLAL